MTTRSSASTQVHALLRREQLQDVADSVTGPTTVPVFVARADGALISSQRLEAENARERAEHMMRTDALTGLENRRQGLAAVDEVLSLAHRAGRPFSLVMLDIDHLESVNDTFGRPVGDDVLVGVCGVAQAALRASDGLYRVGGEEFLVVSQENTCRGAHFMAERLRRSVEEQDFGLPDRRQITASLGVYCWNLTCGPVPSASEALSWADQALYEAKRSRGNRVASHTACPSCAAAAADFWA